MHRPAADRPAPYVPELNPAARVSEEIRRELEGRVFAKLEEKVAAVEALPRHWVADPARLQRLVGWAWSHAAFDLLPVPAGRHSIAA